MNTPSLNDLLRCAQEAARTAGRHAMDNLHRRREVAQSFKHDVKLLLDSECQERAESVIRGAYPDHAILGEEGGEPVDDGRLVWVIDPIDGTVNFTHGLPYWCCSIAVQREGRSIVGVVFAPALRDFYCATLDTPALCNGEPIHVSQTETLSESLALTGLEKTFDTDQGTLEVARAVAMRARKIRLMGAAALDICHVAAGRADAFFESGLYLWDAAAGILLVEKAGGRAEMVEQVDAARRRYLVTNGRIHEELRAVIEAARRPSAHG